MKRINLKSEEGKRFVTSWVDILELFQLAESPAQIYLSADEHTLFEAFRVEKRKREWLAGRVAVKLGVEALFHPQRPSCFFAKASILNGKDRVPFWECSCQPPHLFSFSLSHAHEHAVAYLTDDPNCQLGIDLVKKEPRDPQKLRGFLTPIELDLVSRFPDKQQSDPTHIIWAVKEALAKSLKMGMAIVSSIIVHQIDDLSNIQFELTGKALESFHLQRGRKINCQVKEEDQYWVAYAQLFTACHMF